MGIEGATIVTRHVLDDTDLRRGLVANEQLLRQHTGRMQSVLTFNTAGAQRSIRLLTDAIVLFGGSSSFAVLQAGRLAVSLGRVATAYGAVAVAADVSAAAMARASLAASAGAATAAAGGAGAGLAARATAIATSPATIAVGAAAAIASAVDATIAFVAGTKSVTSRLIEWGKSTYAAIVGTDRATAAANALSASEERMAAIQSNRAAEEFVDRTDQERITGRGRAVIDRFQAEQKLGKAQESAAFLDQQLKVGQANTSRAIDDYIDRTVREGDAMRTAEAQDRARRLEVIEDLNRRQATVRNAIAEQTTGETPFAITSRASSEFRFGAGAAGSVIGVQTEQKQTNKILKELLEEEKKITAALALFNSGQGNPYQPVY